MDYKNVAAHIIESCGGINNITQVSHCVSRLRFHFADNSKLQKEKVDSIEGVYNSVFNAGEYQIILGSNVLRVYDEVVKIVPDAALGEVEETVIEENRTLEKKKSLIDRFLDMFANVIMPLVPCLAAAGFIQAIASCCKQFGWLDTEGGTYQIIYMMGQLCFYFLPILVANSASKRFNMNQYVAMMLVSALLYPTILNAEVDYIKFFGLPIKIGNYTSTIIPAILTVYFASIIKRFLDKFIPKAIYILAFGVCMIFIVVPVELIVLAPLGNYISDGIMFIMSWLLTNAPMLAGAFLGFIHIPCVLTGTQSFEVTLLIQEIISGEGSAILSFTSGANFAVIGISAAIWFINRKKEEGSMYVSTTVSACLGITEPALFGCVVDKKKVLTLLLLLGSVSGVCVSLIGFKAPRIGALGLVKLLIWFDGSLQWMLFVAVIIITIILAFIGTIILYKINLKGDENYELSK